MSKSLRLFVLLLANAATACDGNDSAGAASTTGNAVDCAWFSGDNCFKAVAAEANACITGAGPGVLSGDGLTCRYADGTQIGFARSPIASFDDDYVWDFVVTTNGAHCASYSELGTNGDGGFSLTTASGEFREDVAGTQLNLTCPNGTRSTIGGLDALACLGSGLPGTAWSSSSVAASFSFIGTATQHELFDCQTAP